MAKKSSFKLGSGTFRQTQQSIAIPGKFCPLITKYHPSEPLRPQRQNVPSEEDRPRHADASSPKALVPTESNPARTTPPGVTKPWTRHEEHHQALDRTGLDLRAHCEGAGCLPVSDW